MAKLDLAFKLTANADGVAAGVAQADRELSKVGASSKATAAEFRQAAKITAEMRTPTEKYADTVARLDKMLAKGLLTQEVYGRAVAKAEQEMQSATSSMDKMAERAGLVERVVNGVSGAMEGIGDATKSVAEAGSSVIKFGKDIAITYAQWRLFSALRNPAGLKDFAIGALKGAMAARTMILAAKALGIGLAVGGGGVGVLASAVLGLTNPLIGTTLMAINLGRAFLGAKDRAYEMAAAVQAGTVSMEQLEAAMGKFKAKPIGDLAKSMDEASTANERMEKAFTGFSDVFVTPFVGAFAAIQSGMAGLMNGFSSVIEGITAVVSPVAELLAPIMTLVGTVIEGVLKLVGVIANLLGIVLKVGGAIVRVFLSPFIAGLNVVVNAFRSGMVAVFDYIGSKIEWVSGKIQAFYAFMSKVPVIGGAFASGEEVPSPQAAEQAKKDAENAAREDFEEQQANQRAVTRSVDAYYQATAAAREFGAAGAAAAQQYEQGLIDLNRQLEDGRISSAVYAKEADKLKGKFDAQMEAMRKAGQLDEQMARKQEDIDKIQAEKERAMGGQSNQALQGNDIRSSQGAAQLLALITGREDPAIEENRRTNMKLEEIRKELSALQQEKVEILGAAA